MATTPPTRNPADCICGRMTSADGFRLDIVCPCCDGECVVDRGAELFKDGQYTDAGRAMLDKLPPLSEDDVRALEGNFDEAFKKHLLAFEFASDSYPGRPIDTVAESHLVEAMHRAKDIHLKPIITHLETSHQETPRDLD